MPVGQTTGVIISWPIYYLLTQHHDRQMNMNSCLATQALRRIVYKSNTAILCTRGAYSVSATINGLTFALIEMLRKAKRDKNQCVHNTGSVAY